MSSSCILVGNGGSLLGAGHGALIDSHDFVVRFNAFQISGFEQDAGERSTHWFTVMQPSQDWRSRVPWQEVWTHSWERLPLRCQTFQAVRAAMHCPVQKVPHTFLDEMSFAAATSYRAWSTGALALWGMLTYGGFEEVSLVGFDWWRDPPPAHHYCDPVPLGKLHQPAEEWKLINTLIKQGRIKLHE